MNDGKRRPADDALLGMGESITRRDFLDATLLGVGAALLSSPSPAGAVRPDGGALAADQWTGYGGVGDYAHANGNTQAVISASHRIRDGSYRKLPRSVKDTGEVYDLVVVGGGISGLAAAWFFKRGSAGSKSCLVLENHPVFGGEARQNEFLVNGHRLIGPQGSNQGSIPRAGADSPLNDIWTDLNLAREVRYQDWDPALKPLRFQMDNYSHMEGVDESLVDVGYFFDERSGASKPTWLRNIWANGLQEAPFPEDVKRDLLKWRNSTGENTEEFRRKLDAMSYKDYIERELGLRPEVTKMAEAVVGLINGASPDAVSAFAASQIGMPGTSARVRGMSGPLPLSFPGGNAAYARCYVRSLIPAAMPTASNLEGIFAGKIDFAALDRVGEPTRIRLHATVVRVEHATAAGGSPDHVAVTYEKGGVLRRLKARRVVMASGGWVNKHVLGDLPADMSDAYGQFYYAPAMVVNVALTNWRFLYKLGAPACRWFSEGFGFSCNIRRPMVAGGYQPPFHPDMPTVLTFYLGLYTPGLKAYDQGVMGRARMLEASYADVERRIRRQMVTLFHDSGFDPRSDIAGIILNRWGHARLLQPPGFHFGRDGRPAPREVVEKGFGSILIAHSELNGHQNFTGAMAQGKRAAEQALAGS
jgi:spermidine dehydrogenase